MNLTIDIGKDFTRYPGGRYARLGNFSGEEFRDSFLIPALEEVKDGQVTVMLDGALGYSSSFLEETFGGLIRKGILISQIKEHLDINTSKKLLLQEIWEYIMSEAKDSSLPISE
jgi:hypothetical protein